MKKFLVCLVVLSVVSLSQAALLSGNTVSEESQIFPLGTDAIDTGATYEWLPESDSQILSKDPDFVKMTDGIGVAGGGAHAVFSGWDGTTSYLEFDLKDVYEVTSAAVYTKLDWPNVGLPYMDVYTSLDGTNYTYFGGWLDNPANAMDVLATVNGEAIDARYVKFTFKRTTDWPGQGGRQNWSHQYVVGEAMVYGNAVPEPATLAMLIAGGLGLISRRRK